MTITEAEMQLLRDEALVKLGLPIYTESKREELFDFSQTVKIKAGWPLTRGSIDRNRYSPSEWEALHERLLKIAGPYGVTMYKAMKAKRGSDAA